MLGRLPSVLVYLTLAGLLCIPVSAQRTGVIVNFDPSDPSIGPFPTDNLTAPDPAQKTGLSVHLPMPDCAIQAIS